MKINFREKIKNILLQNIDMYFIISMILIYIFFIIGISFGSLHPGSVEKIVMHQYKTAETVGVYGENGGINILPIFINNVVCAVAIVLSGIMPYMYIPLLAAIFNSCAIGCAYGYCSLEIPIAQTLLQYAPHLLIEFLAMTTASSVGMWICGEAIKRERNKALSISTTQSIKMTLPIFLCVILPLLFTASILEGCGI